MYGAGGEGMAQSLPRWYLRATPGIASYTGPMARKRHLPNAPITEALIDLRVRPREELVPDQLRDASDRLRAMYPTVEEKKIFEAQISLGAGAGRLRQDSGEIYGYFFRTTDGTQVAQFRKDGFTFSRLQPYTEWAHVRAQAADAWAEYVEVAAPQLVTRVAVRYINHLPLPLPIHDFEEYLLAPPRIPEGAPEGLTGFLSRITGRYPSNVVANVTQTLEPSPASIEHVVVLLDIDVFKPETDFDPGDPSVWNLLDHLREVKNDIFFGSITEHTAERFT